MMEMFQKGNRFGESNKGHKRPDLSLRNKKEVSLETRNKMSQTRKALYTSGLLIPWNKGKKLSRIVRYDHPCPRCSSIFIQSQSKLWHCSDCGKTWAKNPIKRKIIERTNNPCPKCSSIHILSRGINWGCKDCGNNWIKIPKKKVINVSKDILEELKKLSQKEIASRLDCSQASISLLMKKFDVKTNPKYLRINPVNPELQREINNKISLKLKGNINWHFSHQFPNKEEQKLIHFFKKWNLPFKYVGDGTFKIDGKCPDFIWEDKKAIIEFFGELWHKSIDEGKRIQFFQKQGWNCLVVWGKEVGWWTLKRQYVNHPWEKQLYNKILRWLSGL
jgi:ribosomal protein L37AE/L43A/transcriptional regulator with XRE-family HTH domain